jgi:hypothetical protein
LAALRANWLDAMDVMPVDADILVQAGIRAAVPGFLRGARSPIVRAA